MIDIIQQTIDGLKVKTTDHFNAVVNLTDQISDSYTSALTGDQVKQIEAFVGRVVSDVENGTIDTYTAETSFDEARKLAEAGDADFVDLMQIGAV